jgi:hypothetical protein
MIDFLSPDDLKVGTSGEVPVEWLTFDPKNPRFVPGNQPSFSERADVIRTLYAEAELRELIQSIAANGYIGIEPMIVMLEADKFVVLEGNRRLAAVLCLRDHTLAADAQISVPEMSSEAKRTLDKINVYRVEKRDDAQEIIGFKHINGPRPWDAFAKARFAANWLDQEEKKGDSGLSLREIAERMGDRHNTLRRMVTAIRVLDQAERDQVWSVDDRTTKRLAFSHLYTGLSYGEVTRYLGVDSGGVSLDPPRDPVPVDRFDETRNLLSWLYGDRRANEDTVIVTQAKSLQKLKSVLASRVATEHLVVSRDLDKAFTTAQPTTKLFLDNLYVARDRLDEAARQLEGFSPKEDGEIVQDLVERLQSRIRTIRLYVNDALSGGSDEQ